MTLIYYIAVALLAYFVAGAALLLVVFIVPHWLPNWFPNY